MRWYEFRRSTNVEDRRNNKTGFSLSGIGLGMARLRARYFGPRRARWNKLVRTARGDPAKLTDRLDKTV